MLCAGTDYYTHANVSSVRPDRVADMAGPRCAQVPGTNSTRGSGSASSSVAAPSRIGRSCRECGSAVRCRDRVRGAGAAGCGRGGRGHAVAVGAAMPSSRLCVVRSPYHSRSAPPAARASTASRTKNSFTAMQVGEASPSGRLGAGRCGASGADRGRGPVRRRRCGRRLRRAASGTARSLRLVGASVGIGRAPAARTAAQARRRVARPPRSAAARAGQSSASRVRSSRGLSARSRSVRCAAAMVDVVSGDV